MKKHIAASLNHLKTWICLAWIICFCNTELKAQNTRLTDKNTIGWYAFTGTFHLNAHWSIHTEYQFRRNNLITDWQQSLVRTGINFQWHPKLALRAGYAWIETFNYGDIPINSYGKQFTEQRLYQMATLTDKMAKSDLSHRFILEQRWIGRYSSPAINKEDGYAFVNRLRYMFRLQVPISRENSSGKMAYAALYDEIFIGFGKNVNENVFDQNRLGLVLGYRMSPALKLEAGFLSQVAQLSREISGRNVFQNNNGLIVSLKFDANLFKKPEPAS